MKTFRLCGVLVLFLLACGGTAAPLLSPQATVANSSTADANPICIPSSDVNAGYNGQTICVFGNITAIDETKDSEFYFIRFTDRTTPGFYIMLKIKPALQVGECISMIGVLSLDAHNVPFMDAGEIKTCPK